MRRFEAGRDLYIWNLERDQVRHVETLPTKAQPQVRWAPNGKFLAFSDPQQGLVVVDTSGGGGPFVFAEDVAVFDWMSDSATIALVEKNRDGLDLIDVSTGKLQSQVLAENIKILDVAASPTRNSILLVESAGLRWKIEIFDTGTLKRSALVRSSSRLASPTWLPNGKNFCFQRVDGNSETLLLMDQASGTLTPLKNLGGTNDIRGIFPDGHAVVLAHRGRGPMALFALPLSGERPKLIYGSHSMSLPAVKAEPVTARADNGTQVPLVVWLAQAGRGEPAAVIRVRGGIGTIQLPVWEEHVQIFIKHGIHFIGLNNRGEGATPQQLREDVLAAIQYAHRTLRVPYERIVVLGHSSGAGLAAATCLANQDRCGILVLVAFGAVREDLRSAKPKGLQGRLLLFYPAYDSTPRGAVLQNLKAAFGDKTLNDPRTSFYQFPDDHNLNNPRSWAAVYSAILAQFNFATCAADGEKRERVGKEE
jgi:dipeptidyl aminopeptidase/acylaminoacyl peptidase